MIRVNGRVAATLPWTVAHDLGIERGTEWTDDLAGRVAQAVQFDRARRRAWRVIERRAVSSGELIERLRRRDFDIEIAREVADELTRAGYLDDAAYARAVLRELTREKPAGEALMRRKLMQKRLDRETIDRAIRAVRAERDEEDLDYQHGDMDADGDPERSRDQIAAFVHRKLRRMGDLDEATRARRLYGALARRGFDPQTCRDYVERFVRGRDEEGDGA